MSCAGNGYLSANELVPFPFEDGQFLGWTCDDRNGAQLALQKCFVDACVVVRAQALAAGEWPSVGAFAASGSSIGFSVACRGQAARFSASASDVRFPIVSGETPWGSCVVVLSSEGIREFCEFCASNGVSPPSPGSSSSLGMDGGLSLRLCARCVTLVPAALASIRVYDGVGERSKGPHFVLRGDVAVKPGNNMALAEPDDAENGIRLDATPGAGMGVVGCACETAGSRPGLAGPDGHVRLFNDTCYDLEPCETSEIVVDGARRKSRTLRIHAKCTACCTCAMYESIVNDRLAALFASVSASNGRIGELSAAYESAVAAFNARMRTPELSDVTLSLSATPLVGKAGSDLSGTGITGRMMRCAFSAVVRNTSAARILATVNTMSGTDTIVEASAAWSAEDGSPLSRTGDAKGAVVGSTFEIFPGRSLAISFVSVKDELSERVVRSAFSGSVSVGLSYRNGDSYGSLGTLSRTVEA